MNVYLSVGVYTCSSEKKNGHLSLESEFVVLLVSSQNGWLAGRMATKMKVLAVCKLHTAAGTGVKHTRVLVIIIAWWCSIAGKPGS